MKYRRVGGWRMRHGIRCWLNISINILITIFIEATYCETRQLVYVGISIGSMHTFKPRSFGRNLNQAMTLLPISIPIYNEKETYIRSIFTRRQRNKHDKMEE